MHVRMTATFPVLKYGAISKNVTFVDAHARYPAFAAQWVISFGHCLTHE